MLSRPYEWLLPVNFGEDGIGVQRRTSAGAVVATDSVSVDFEYDNGAGLHDAPRRRRGHDHVVKRVEASVGE
jgi:hypothetical protein